MASTQGVERGLKRFEGFTYAVFAIALTLLFLEIKPPGSPDGPPAGAHPERAVAEQWREHLALIVSFLGIGIYGCSIITAGGSTPRATTSSACSI